MIKVVRGPEPEALRKSRRWRLAKARLATKPDTSDGYDPENACKDVLAKHAGEVCSYCEMSIYKKGSPVEHYRPREKYWWLTWSWDNLLFVCGKCNTEKLKAFELEDDTNRAKSPADDLTKERPKLLDPTQEDPRLHIRFRRTVRDKQDRVVAYAVCHPGVGISQKGEFAIDLFGLDRNDHLQGHVQDLMRSVEDMRGHMESGKKQKVQESWGRILDTYLDHGKPFRSATWDILNGMFMGENWAEWDLVPLGKLAPDDVGSAISEAPDPPGLDRLPEALQDHVRALLRNSLWEEVKPVLVNVRAQGSWTEEQLAELFERSPATVKGWLKKLKDPTAIVEEE